MQFKDIHGKDRVYAIVTKSGKVARRSFAISGFGSRREAAKEARFRTLLGSFHVKYTFRDISF